MYEWLNSYQEIENRIGYLEFEVERYKAELKRWCNSEDLGRYALVKDSRASKLEEIIEGYEWDLAHEMNTIYDLKKVIYGFKGLNHHILRMKYVEGLTLKEIAGELGYGIDHIKKRHSAVLKGLKSKNRKSAPFVHPKY